MKANQIEVGQIYMAKVSGKVVPVRVDDIYDQCSIAGRWTKNFDVTNLATGRKLTFRSAAKFRGEAKAVTA